MAWPLNKGIGSQPAPEVAFSERIAVVGEGLILARRSGFGWLRARRGALLESFIPSAVPVAQAAGPRGWVGWTRPVGDDSGPAELWLAPLQPGINQPEPFQAALPTMGAALAPRATVAVRDDTAWWLGIDGGLWCADIATGEIVSSFSPGLLTSGNSVGASLLWVNQNGRPGIVAEHGAGASLAVWLAPERSGELPHSPLAAGAGPLRSVHVAGGWLVVVGDVITTVGTRDATTRDIGTVRLPAGRWVAGCLTVEEHREVGGRTRQWPQLIALMNNSQTLGGGMGMSNLAVIDLSTSTVDSIAADTLDSLSSAPIGLLAAEDSLFVAHVDGIVSITWKGKGD